MPWRIISAVTPHCCRNGKPERERIMSLKQYLTDNPDIKKFWLSSMEMCGECKSDDTDMLELFGNRIVLSVEKGNITMIYVF